GARDLYHNRIARTPRIETMLAGAGACWLPLVASASVNERVPIGREGPESPNRVHADRAASQSPHRRAPCAGDRACAPDQPVPGATAGRPVDASLIRHERTMPR